MDLPLNLKKYPFVRLLIPLIAGIIVQWYIPVEISLWYLLAVLGTLILIVFNRLRLAEKYRLRSLAGGLFFCVFVAAGAILVYHKDIRTNKYWYGHSYSDEQLCVTLSEPPIVKPNSFKAEARVVALKDKNEIWRRADGKIILYFNKSINPTRLIYGTTLVVKQPVQPIKNSTNPGAFDYRRYCLFQGITGQVYLESKSFIELPVLQKNLMETALIAIRNSTISTLRQHIPGKDEQAIAEALLIGYRHDLDKELVQAYSNTGVVHIIAISGLHLGMIYGLLLLLLSKTGTSKHTRFIKPVIILFVIWAFTLVAGAVPSILRSAIMFSFLVVGQYINRKTYAYNTLAVSAFCILAFDPFVLWNVGFLLSYAAVLSIITFLKPVSNWFYFRNPLLEKIWKLTAVTISAQVLTIPIVIFYFHQFPNLFLFSNLLVVPLSGIILYGEIALLIISPFEKAAAFLGIILEQLINWMNRFILFLDKLDFSVWQNLQIDVYQTWMLFAIILSAVAWLQWKRKKALLVMLVFANLFLLSISINFIKSSRQQQLIVYDVPKHSAIDLVKGNHYYFIGDSIMQYENSLKNFHLQPARIQMMCNNDSKTSIPYNTIVSYSGYRSIILNELFEQKRVHEQVPVHLIILTKNVSMSASDLAANFIFDQLVADGSVSNWKTQKLKKECEALHLPFYSVSEQGAFVLDFRKNKSLLK